MNANSHLAIVLLAVLAFTSTVSAHTRTRPMGDSDSSEELMIEAESSIGESSTDFYNPTEDPVVIPTECPTTNDGNAVHIAHESDCSIFYKCNHGEKLLVNCPYGLSFNPVAQVCDWPELGGCTAGDWDDSDKSTETEPPTGESSTDSWTLESSGDGELESSTENDLEISDSITEAPVVIPTECPATNEGNAVHIAHESDCGLYYQCNHGERVLQQCPSGLAFNPIAQVCDWPDHVGCTPGGSEDSEDSTETEPPTSESSTDSWTPESSGGSELESDTENDLEISSSTTEAPVVIPTECPDTNEGNAVHIAHESDSSKFYQCHNGQKILLECVKGLEFNAAAQVCDWPMYAQSSVSASDGRIVLMHDGA